MYYICYIISLLLNLPSCSMWPRDCVTITVTMSSDVTDVWQYDCDITFFFFITQDTCCGNYLSQGQMITQGSKSLKSDIEWEVHKRTWQGVSAKLEFYIYKVHMVCATSSYLLHFLLKATMLYTCVLTSSFRSFYYILGLWCHMPLHYSKEK